MNRSETKFCPHCQRSIPIIDTVCVHCKYPVESLPCSDCGTTIEALYRVCRNCGFERWERPDLLSQSQFGPQHPEPRKPSTSPDVPPTVLESTVSRRRRRRRRRSIAGIDAQPPEIDDLQEEINDQRKERQANLVAGQVAAGGRVESQGDYQAIVVEGRRVNHVLHVILSFLTCGFWIIVWIVLGIAGGEKRKLVKVDEDGNETVTRL